MAMLGNASHDGGGGPRFWFSVSPELPQLNYAFIRTKAKNLAASQKA